MVDIDSREFETNPKIWIEFWHQTLFFFFYHLNVSSYQGYLITLGQATHFWYCLKCFDFLKVSVEKVESHTCSAVK